MSSRCRCCAAAATGYFQIARSRNEFATDAGPHTFATDLAVERGDRLGIVMVAGSAVGMRPAARASTSRWLPPLRGASCPRSRARRASCCCASTTSPARTAAPQADQRRCGDAAARRQGPKSPARTLSGTQLTRRSGATRRALQARSAAREAARIPHRPPRRCRRRQAAGVRRADADARQFYAYVRWVGLAQPARDRPLRLRRCERVLLHRLRRAPVRSPAFGSSASSGARDGRHLRGTQIDLERRVVLTRAQPRRSPRAALPRSAWPEHRHVASLFAAGVSERRPSHRDALRARGDDAGTTDRGRRRRHPLAR